MEDGQPLAFVRRTFEVYTCASPDIPRLFWDLTTWELLNMGVRHVLDLPQRLNEQFGITPVFIENALSPHVVQTTGMVALMNKYEIKRPPQYLIARTKHYSWPKAAGMQATPNILEEV